MTLTANDEPSSSTGIRTCTIAPRVKPVGECVSFVVQGRINSQIDYTVNIGDIFTSHASLTILELPCVQGSEVYIDFLHGGTPLPSWQNYFNNIKSAITSIQGDITESLSANFDVEATVENLEFLAKAFEIANP